MTIRRTTLFTSMLLGLSLTYGSAYADQSTPTMSDSTAVAPTYRDAQAVCSEAVKKLLAGDRQSIMNMRS